MVQKYYFFLIYTNYKRKKCIFSHFLVIPLFQRSLVRRSRRYILSKQQQNDNISKWYRSGNGKVSRRSTANISHWIFWFFWFFEVLTKYGKPGKSGKSIILFEIHPYPSRTYNLLVMRRLHKLIKLS